MMGLMVHTWRLFEADPVLVGVVVVVFAALAVAYVAMRLRERGGRRGRSR